MVSVNLNKENFEKEVSNSEKPVVIDFWADWCAPCKMMGPVFEELSEEMQELKFAKVNVDEESELAGQFSIQGIPTISVVKQGKEIDRFSGFMAKEDLKEKIENILNK